MKQKIRFRIGIILATLFFTIYFTSLVLLRENNVFWEIYLIFTSGIGFFGGTFSIIYFFIDEPGKE